VRFENVGGPRRIPVDAVDPGGRGQCGQAAYLGSDAEQPATQAVRTRRLRGIGHPQASGDENVTGGGDRRVCIRPQQFGARVQHRGGMLANHDGHHRRACPLRLGLPEPLH
jgi:hypothetical protein